MIRQKTRARNPKERENDDAGVLGARKEETMFYIAVSKKEFDRVVTDLEAAVKRHGFGVLYVHDVGATLRGKGIDFPERCRIFEVCQPVHAAKVMAADMRLNMALPCRISVYTEKGGTRIGMVLPTAMLAALSSDPALEGVAREVEAQTRKMIDEAAGASGAAV